MGDSIAIVNTTLIVIGMVVGIYFLWLWRKDKLRQLELQKEEAEREKNNYYRQQELAQAQLRHQDELRKLQEDQLAEQKRHQEELRNLQEEEEQYRQRNFQNEQIEIQKEQMRQAFDNAAQQMAGSGSGGYLIIDLPAEKRSLFHDLLKGFEEYAHLKGYKINFSIDNTFPDKMAFKFTLADAGVNVTAEKVRKDLKARKQGGQVLFLAKRGCRLYRHSLFFS